MGNKKIPPNRGEVRFDIIGNLPEDIIAEVISHLTEFSDLRRLIIWQIVNLPIISPPSSFSIPSPHFVFFFFYFLSDRRNKVSKTWRRILHSPCTKVYHQVILHNHRLRALLPPPHYYDSDESFFSYAVFRRAMRQDLAIRKGSFRSAVPEIHKACGDFVAFEVCIVQLSRIFLSLYIYISISTSAILRRVVDGAVDKILTCHL
jgi:hypothetical protein